MFFFTYYNNNDNTGASTSTSTLQSSEILNERGETSGRANVTESEREELSEYIGEQEVERRESNERENEGEEDGEEHLNDHVGEDEEEHELENSDGNDDDDDINNSDDNDDDEDTDSDVDIDAYNIVDTDGEAESLHNILKEIYQEPAGLEKVLNTIPDSLPTDIRENENALNRYMRLRKKLFLQFNRPNVSLPYDTRYTLRNTNGDIVSKHRYDRYNDLHYLVNERKLNFYDFY